jgi:hypothetical protein
MIVIEATRLPKLAARQGHAISRIHQKHLAGVLSRRLDNRITDRRGNHSAGGRLGLVGHKNHVKTLGRGNKVIVETVPGRFCPFSGDKLNNVIRREVR